MTLRGIRRFFRRAPVVERRFRVCDKGSIFPEDKTEWSAELPHPEAVAFREKYPNLYLSTYCPTSHYDAELHVRHIIEEERVR